MSILGLKEAEVAPLVRAIAGEHLEAEELHERFARAAWTGIAEPGDRVAGILVARIGATEALEAIVSRANTDSIANRLEGEVSDDELQQAVERWAPRLQSRVALLALSQAARYAVRLLIPGDPSWPSGVDDLGPHAAAPSDRRPSAEHPSEAALTAAGVSDHAEHLTEPYGERQPADRHMGRAGPVRRIADTQIAGAHDDRLS